MLHTHNHTYEIWDKPNRPYRNTKSMEFCLCIGTSFNKDYQSPYDVQKHQNYGKCTRDTMNACEHCSVRICCPVSHHRHCHRPATVTQKTDQEKYEVTPFKHF